ncbi:hypothetical protein P3W45_001773 [Vairimorpha bombi]|jgi:hypothetical protein
MMLLNILYVASSFVNVADSISSVFINKYKQNEYINITYKKGIKLIEVFLRFNSERHEAFCYEYSKKISRCEEDYVSCYNTKSNVSGDRWDEISHIIMQVIRGLNFKYPTRSLFVLDIKIQTKWGFLDKKKIYRLFKSIGIRINTEIIVLQDYSNIATLNETSNHVIKNKNTGIEVQTKCGSKIYIMTVSPEDINLGTNIESKLIASNCFILNDIEVISRFLRNLDYQFIHNYIYTPQSYVNYLKFQIKNKKNSTWIENEYHKFKNSSKKYSELKEEEKNLKDRLEAEIKFFRYCSILSKDSYDSLLILFQSLPQDVLNMIITKIFDKYNEEYGSILLPFLRDALYISKADFEILFRLNRNKVSKLIARNLKLYSLDLNEHFHLLYCDKGYNIVYILVIVCKVLEDIYINDENNEWKKIYDELLEICHLEKKPDCLIDLFHIFISDKEAFKGVIEDFINIMDESFYKNIKLEKRSNIGKYLYKKLTPMLRN